MSNQERRLPTTPPDPMDPGTKWDRLYNYLVNLERALDQSIHQAGRSQGSQETQAKLWQNLAKHDLVDQIMRQFERISDGLPSPNETTDVLDADGIELSDDDFRDDN